MATSNTALKTSISGLTEDDRDVLAHILRTSLAQPFAGWHYPGDDADAQDRFKAFRLALANVMDGTANL